jgi:hypothetical protein
MKRTIIIEANKEDNWGGRIYVTQMYDPAIQFWHKGKVELDSVLMKNLGQGNTTQAGLTFERMSQTAPDSIVINCIMRDSEGWNALFRAARNVRIENNLFWRSKQRGIVFEETINDIVFSNNWVMGNEDRGLILEQVSTDLYDYTVAFYAAEAEFKDTTVTHNTFASCGNTCVAFPGGDCSAASWPWVFEDNLAHSGVTGWVAFTSSSTSTCIRMSKFVGWNLEEGLVSYFKANRVEAQQIFLAEVQKGFTLATGAQSGDHEVVITNSHVISLLDGAVAGAYTGKSASCSNGAGIVLSVATEEVKVVPPTRSLLPWRRVKSNHLWQGKLTVSTVKFENFNNDVAECQNNMIFRSNEYAADAHSIATFADITRVNIGANNVYYFSEANPEWINLVDCGGWQCTGLKNILVKDLTGSLTGSGNPMTLIPANTGVVDATCTLYPSMNGYSCSGVSWGLLTFGNEDEDKETRIITPINVTRPGFRNDLNTYMDHYTDVQEADFESPLRRLSRWHSLIRTGFDDYEILYRGTLPNVMKFQLQGGDSNSIIVKQRYTKSQVIQLTKLDGSIIRPAIPKDGILASDPCGANYYKGVDQVVYFKLTGDPTCIVKTEVTNAVKGRVRYSIDIDEFFSQEGPTKFIDNVVMILGIDPTRIRTVDIVKGSTIIDFNVIGENQAIPDSSNSVAVNNELKALVQQLNSAVSDGRMAILNSAVLDSDFTISIKSEYYDEPEETIATQSPILIIIVAGAVSVAIVLIGAYFVYRKYLNLKNKVKPNIANIAGGRYGLAKAGSEANFIYNSGTIGDLKLEDAEQQIPIKSMTDTPQNKAGESKIRMFAKGKSARSNIWDREDVGIKNKGSEDNN